MALPSPLYARVNGLLTCAELALAQTTNGPVCDAWITEPGQEGGPPPLDLPDCCECGSGDGVLVAWFGRIYPSREFPIQDDDPRARCGVAYGVTVNLRLSRCATIPDDHGDVSRDRLAQHAERQLEDGYTLLRAVRCCIGCQDDDGILGDIRFGNDGGCLTVTVSVTLRFVPKEAIDPAWCEAAGA